jgi:uncharacterized delta-60 repeat protein
MAIPAKLSAAAAALTLLAACAAGAVAAPGDLDPTFGDAGLSVVDLGGSDFVSEIAQRPDGRIVIGGTLAPPPAFDDSNFDGFVAQLGAKGALDGSFGTGGGGFLQIARSPADGISDIAIRPDGRIVAVGNTNGDGLVARLPAAGGSLDPSFGGGDGFATVPFGGEDFLSSLALQPDGKLVVAGASRTGGAVLAGAGLPTIEFDGVFARLKEADGDFDDSFADGGAFGEDFGSTFLQVNDIALQPDGKIVFAGTILRNGGSDFVVGRLLNPSGDLDPSFGGGTGRTFIDFGQDDFGRSVAIGSDGKIVVAGSSFASQPGRGDELAAARLLANGQPDPSFAGDGSTTVDLGGSESGGDVAIQPGGKILLLGTTTAGASGKDDMGVARLRVDGSLDLGFGTGGRALVDFGAFEDGEAIALRPDGGILVAGGTRATERGSLTDIAVARLQGGEPAGGPVGPGGAGGPGGAAGLTAVCAGKRATIVGTAGRNRLRGTPRADVIAGLGGNDVIAGLGGNDVVCGGAGNDQVDGGAGADRLIGGAGTDRLAGGAGADRMEGGAGADKLLGGAGKDRLLGGAGADKLVGGGGVDALLGGAGRNTRTQ